VRTTKQRLTCGNASHLHERPRFKEVFQAAVADGGRRGATVHLAVAANVEGLTWASAARRSASRRGWSGLDPEQTDAERYRGERERECAEENQRKNGVRPLGARRDD
jgi:hypothetical protein